MVESLDIDRLIFRFSGFRTGGGGGGGACISLSTVFGLGEPKAKKKPLHQIPLGPRAIPFTRVLTLSESDRTSQATLCLLG